MAIAIDQLTLGNGFDDTLDASWAFNTTATVASGGFIVVVIGWFGGTPSLSSVSGGSLTWAVDVTGFGGSLPSALAIASAQAPAGLASGTTLTITLTDVAVGKFATALSFTGVKTSSALDGIPPAQTENTTAGWATGSYSIQAGSVIVGGVWQDNVSTNTPVAPSLEASEQNSPFNTLVAEYRIESSAGSYTVAGTLSGAAEWTAAAAAYLAPSVSPAILQPGKRRSRQTSW